ncbi:hypothetical protein AtubIFM55763_009758 [Aspergillus tubingensis]|uniref:Uncharacterized protein n=1 Tax=Aspergillus niger TaxID=5061 RepID=A0A100IRU3_ASPNG|nr:nitric oxide synthase, oxygenase domain family protein [Aspergillus tubingensis]GAQ46164.1 hypothetical protein AKAW_01416 [Aspergillus niger]GFN10543.1 nitric oxide synthase, oxygenase domain family protein [Aspergillus tubingensis]GLA63279.1 hypothetical protein AtubIFM54640_004419 [Aspergillus tubingensis]GLA77569.1 hypothetical protein AtubIFM55763_009758 [Aspergillus tubingensis]GLA93833.1 hypothetical protein AtubIFM57143_000684 [Aspergillus tubingensis]
MSDPCLFHATLFSASASIDMLQGQQHSARTLYHHTWAIRLINERLAQTEPVLDYGTLGAVVPLLYYNMLALDRDSAVAHQKGLVKMLLATPQSFRADIGPLIAIVKIAMLSFACIYDVLPVWDCLSSESVRPNTILRNVVSRATLGNDESSFEKETADAILDVYEAISRLDYIVHGERGSISAEVERALSFATTKSWTGRPESSLPLTPPETLNVCCQICCELFWKVLLRSSHSQQAPDMAGDHAVRQLLKYLSQIEPLYWIRNAPEVFTWAAFTGAAASEHQDTCVAFISKAGTILTAIDDEELTLIRQGWRYFRLLKGLAGDDN